MSWKELDQFKEDNHLKQQVTTSGFHIKIHGMQGKMAKSGFNEVLSKVAEAHSLRHLQIHTATNQSKTLRPNKLSRSTLTKAQSRYKIDPMTKLKTQLLELHELEHIHLDTVQEDGKRYYVDKKGERYPYNCNIFALTRDQIKLWRERVGEEKANKVSSRKFLRRGTKFHSLVEDYLRKEKDYIEFEDVMQEAQFKGIQPVLDEIVPIALEAPMYSENLKMAGRVDCIGMFDNILSIIDFKTSSKFKEDYMAIF